MVLYRLVIIRFSQVWKIVKNFMRCGIFRNLLTYILKKTSVTFSSYKNSYIDQNRIIIKLDADIWRISKGEAIDEAYHIFFMFSQITHIFKCFVRILTIREIILKDLKFFRVSLFQYSKLYFRFIFALRTISIHSYFIIIQSRFNF